MNPFDLLKNQFGHFQDLFKKQQQALAGLEVTGEAGVPPVGQIKVVMNGLFHIKQLSVDEAAFKEGKAFVEELTRAAFNDAVAKVWAQNQHNMSGMMSQFGLQGNDQPK